jgi:hypothetical protein
MILVDTGAWIALTDTSDQCYPKSSANDMKFMKPLGLIVISR